LLDGPKARRSQLRQRLSASCGVRLNYDGQLLAFGRWAFEQEALDALGELAADDEDRLRRRFPNLSLEKIREAVLWRCYAMARALDDTKLALKVLAADAYLVQVQTARERHELETAQKLLDGALRAKADEINDSDLSQAEKIAAMRKVYFQDVDALAGKLELPG
jgi:hypothetical protein